MGYVTREIEGGSMSFSSTYPAFYKELQIQNWTPVDICITDITTGRQSFILRWREQLDSRATYVEISHRECCGLRSKDVRGHRNEIPIPAKQFTIPYTNFLSYPVRVDEVGVIISTREHSLVAKNMVVASGYGADASETISDYGTTDPRFVFEVRDPFNRWEYLYANVMGQTIELRCGHSGKMLADLDEASVASMYEECTLSCFIRYPSNYTINMDDRTVPVFVINLKDIDLEEPYVLPSGDIVCIAGDLEALQRVVAKKHAGSPCIQIAGMMPKEIHDKLIATMKTQLADDKQAHLKQLQQVKLDRDGEIAELKVQLEDEKRKVIEKDRQLSYWSSLHEATVDRSSREDKLHSQYEKSRTETLENEQRDKERFWDTVKIGGGIAAALISFAIGLLIKTSKK